MAENSDTWASLLGENELQHLSVKWRNKSITYSAALGLILTNLLTPGNDRGVTPHSIDQSNQFCSSALRSIEQNAFTIFIQNSSLVDNHSTKYKPYIDMDDEICSVLDHCLELSRPTWLKSFYRHN